MTGRINTFRTAVIERIKTMMPAAKTVEAQFGRFDLDELERTMLRCPAVRVAALQCAAFIVTDGKDRDEAGWTMAEAIATLMQSGQLWGLTRLGAPDKVKIQPVVSASIRDRGVAIIAIEWSQTVRSLGENIFDEAGVLLEELYVNDVRVIGGVDE